jgi:putative methyltransferase (TIGR04325 family)
MRRVLDVLRDVYTYRYFNDPHRAPQYRGVYSSFAGAVAAFPKNQPQGFDDVRVADMFVVEHPTMSPWDYPNLFWLSRILGPKARIFDLGGGIGQCYYFYKQEMDLPKDLEWTVCDLPALAQRGAEFAAARGASNLHFTANRAEADGATIYMSNGALQYIESDLCEILAQLEKKPEHLLINRVPMYDGEPYYTVQSSFHSYCAHKVMNTARFVSGIESLGYRKVNAWDLPRNLRIPFHPERFVVHFKGFYFRRDADGA